jgi:hypothetical protein
MDSISFLAADLTSEAFNRPQQWNETRQSEIALTGAEVTELDHEIEQLIAASSSEFASGFIAENPAKLRKIATHFKAHLGLSDESAPMCNAPWNSAVIEADGAVRPCFFHRVIGNIREQSLDNVLNSPQALAFRNALEVEMNSICRRCVCSLNYKEGKKESLLTIATQTTKRGDTQSPAYP